MRFFFLLLTELLGLNSIPVQSDIVVALVININKDCFSSVDFDSWSWKISIHCQYAFCRTESRIIGLSHLQGNQTDSLISRGLTICLLLLKFK